MCSGDYSFWNTESLYVFDYRAVKPSSLEFKGEMWRMSPKWSKVSLQRQKNPKTRCYMNPCKYLWLIKIVLDGLFHYQNPAGHLGRLLFMSSYSQTGTKEQKAHLASLCFRSVDVVIIFWLSNISDRKRVEAYVSQPPGSGPGSGSGPPEGFFLFFFLSCFPGYFVCFVPQTNFYELLHIFKILNLTGIGVYQSSGTWPERR